MAELSSPPKRRVPSSSSSYASRKSKHNLFHIRAGRSASKLCTWLNPGRLPAPKLDEVKWYLFNIKSSSPWSKESNCVCYEVTAKLLAYTATYTWLQLYVTTTRDNNTWLQHMTKKRDYNTWLHTWLATRGWNPEVWQGGPHTENVQFQHCPLPSPPDRN